MAVNCPIHKKDLNGRKGKCLYYQKCQGKCFTYCDSESALKCGDCAHWEGHVTIGENRHKMFGRCFHHTGTVCSYFRTSCPYYTERKQNELPRSDWIEARVLELGGKPDSSFESRQLRIQARKEWELNHKQ